MKKIVPTDSTPQQSRRAFMKSSATIATATALTRLPEALAAGQAPSTGVLGANDRIVVGHIGTGAQGMAHVRSQQEHASENNIVQAAVCDLYERRLKEAQDKVGLADKDAYDDYRRLLERKDIDAVTVATVDNWHAQVAIDAMESGKHVYGEKPMTRYLGEAFQVYDTCKRTGKVFQLGSQGCADSKYQAARKWIREGRLGPLVWGQAS